MEILTWIIVGLVAGVLASIVVGGPGYGIIGDIVTGIAGAFIGGWVFSAAGWRAPGGLAGVIFVAFIGAALLLILVRAINRGSSSRPSRLRD